MAGARRVTAAPAEPVIDTPSADVSVEAEPGTTDSAPGVGLAVTYTLTVDDVQTIYTRRGALGRFLRHVDPRQGTMPGVFVGQPVAAFVTDATGVTPRLTCLLPGGDTWDVANVPESTEVGQQGAWTRMAPIVPPVGGEV